MSLGSSVCELRQGVFSELESLVGILTLKEREDMTHAKDNNFFIVSGDVSWLRTAP